jgi:hypothetical protein
MQRPPISSTNGRYESPRSRMEIRGLMRAIISKNNIAIKVLPPPEAAMMRRLASAREASHGENGTSCLWGVSSKISGACGIPRHEVSTGSRSAA